MKTMNELDQLVMEKLAEETDKDKATAAKVVGGAVAAGGAAHGFERGHLTGRETLYHGTNKANVDDILREGVKASKASDPTNLTHRTLVDGGHITADQAKGKTYFGTNPIVSKSSNIVREQAELRAKALKNPLGFNFDFSEPGSKSDILKGRVPTWKMDIVENPELRGAKNYKEYGQKMEDGIRRQYRENEAFKALGTEDEVVRKAMKEGGADSKLDKKFMHWTLGPKGTRVIQGDVGAEYLTKSPKYSRAGLGEVAEYIKANPKRFAKGLAPVGAGLALMGGAHHLQNRSDDDSKQAAEELYASEIEKIADGIDTSPFSDKYKNFLRNENKGYYEEPSNIFGRMNEWSTMGDGNDVLAVNEEDQKNWTPLQNDGGGNYYMLNNKDNKVYFFDHEEGYLDPTVFYNSLDDFEKDQVRRDIEWGHSRPTMPHRDYKSEVLQENPTLSESIRKNRQGQFASSAGGVGAAVPAMAGLGALALGIKERNPKMALAGAGFAGLGSAGVFTQRKKNLGLKAQEKGLNSEVRNLEDQKYSDDWNKFRTNYEAQEKDRIQNTYGFDFSDKQATHYDALIEKIADEVAYEKLADEMVEKTAWTMGEAPKSPPNVLKPKDPRMPGDRPVNLLGAIRQDAKTLRKRKGQASEKTAAIKTPGVLNRYFSNLSGSAARAAKKDFLQADQRYTEALRDPRSFSLDNFDPGFFEPYQRELVAKGKALSNADKASFAARVGTGIGLAGTGAALYAGKKSYDQHNEKTAANIVDKLKYDFDHVKKVYSGGHIKDTNRSLKELAGTIEQLGPESVKQHKDIFGFDMPALQEELKSQLKQQRGQRKRYIAAPIAAVGTGAALYGGKKLYDQHNEKTAAIKMIKPLKLGLAGGVIGAASGYSKADKTQKEQNPYQEFSARENENRKSALTSGAMGAGAGLLGGSVLKGIGKGIGRMKMASEELDELVMEKAATYYGIVPVDNELIDQKTDELMTNPDNPFSRESVRLMVEMGLENGVNMKGTYDDKLLSATGKGAGIGALSGGLGAAYVAPGILKLPLGIAGLALGTGAGIMAGDSIGKKLYGKDEKTYLAKNPGAPSRENLTLSTMQRNKIADPKQVLSKGMTHLDDMVNASEEASMYETPEEYIREYYDGYDDDFARAAREYIKHKDALPQWAMPTKEAGSYLDHLVMTKYASLKKPDAEGTKHILEEPSEYEPENNMPPDEVYALEDIECEVCDYEGQPTETGFCPQCGTLGGIAPSTNVEQPHTAPFDTAKTTNIVDDSNRAFEG